MKINNIKSDVSVVGNITSNKVGIDLRNIDFITTILSTNLYSKPINSLIRETVSNAWDSHIEKGTKDPILIELKEDKSNNKDYFKVRDFGVGITKERFDKIYRNIGSSTKRADNQQIGGWGLGRFSPLSYTDTVFLTSYAENIVTKYIMYKDNNSIKIDEVFSKPMEPDDKTGLEVFIYLKSYDKPNFYNAIFSELLYFDNIYLNTDINVNKYYNIVNYNFNDVTFTHYKTFSIINNAFKIKSEWNCSILLGHVEYPIKWEAIDVKYYRYRYLPIVLKFNIGELNVTPNREALLYNEENIQKINAKFEEFKQEFEGLCTKNCVDYNNLTEYIEQITCKNICEIDLAPNCSINVEGIIDNYCNCTYKGIYYPTNEIKNGIDFINLLYFKGVSTWEVYYDRILSLNNFLPFSRHDHLNTSHVNCTIYKCNVSELKNISKLYLRSLINNRSDDLKRVICIKNKSTDELKQHFKENALKFDSWCKILKSYDTKTKSFLDEYNQYLIEQYQNFPVFTNNDVPQSFIDSEKERQRKQRAENLANKERKTINWSTTINVYIPQNDNEYRKNWLSRKYLYSDFNLNTEIKYIYGTTEDIRVDYCYILFKKIYTRYIFMKVAPTKINLLDKLELPNVISIDKFIEDNQKEFPKFITAKKLSIKYGFINLNYFDNIKNEGLFNFVNYINSYIFKYKVIVNCAIPANTLISTFCDVNDLDPELIQYLNDNENYSRCYTLLSELGRNTIDSIATFFSIVKTENLYTLTKEEEEYINQSNYFKKFEELKFDKYYL